MPDGVVQWFDTATGEGRILHRGRRYAMRSSGSETAAQTPGARVHFDIDHDARGDVATNVTLRPGRRVSKRQRRFGDLTGAASPDAKGSAPFATDQPDLGHDLQRRPMAVVERWTALLSDGDLDAAMLLYAPDAALHAEGMVHWGPAEIHRFWKASPMVAGAPPEDIEGENGTIVVRWEGVGADGATVESHLRVSHGEIAEQWLGTVWRTPVAEAAPTPVELSATSDIDEMERSYALEKIGKVLGTIGVPVLHTSVRLERAPDPARERPALARVTVDLDGEPVRAHVAAGTITEAVDLLEGRLRHRLEHLADHREALRRRPASSPEGEWRHGDLPEQRPPYFPRPADERQIVRHKSFAAPEATVDEAVFDLEAMDHRFLLFTDLATGQDAEVERLGDQAYRLQFLHGPSPDVGVDTVAPVEVVDHAAPVLTVDQAREHLDLGDETHVFFHDAGSGRGRVLYRRYDGHYGLVTPADADRTAAG